MRVKSKPKLSPEYRLAVLNAGGWVPSDHVTVFRFRYLLKQLDIRCRESEEEIADTTVRAQRLIREKYGREISLLSMMEEMNKCMIVLQREGDGDYTGVIAIQIILWGEGL